MTVINDTADNALATIPTESVQCCITSPPYFGLRDYGVPGQLGHEATIAQYIDAVANTVMSVWRVLKNDGLLFLNIGDTYMANRARGQSRDRQTNCGSRGHFGKIAPSGGVRPKSLCAIPQRLAVRLIDSGWILRNEIIWHKPNAQPSAVVDRFTVDHEPVFMFSKRQSYRFNQQLEPFQTSGTYHARPNHAEANAGLLLNFFNPRPEFIPPSRKGRNMRTVWRVATQPGKYGHVAPFPETLVSRIIEASTRPGDTVIDPFAGSGTVAAVAKKLGRNSVSIEINPDYAAIIRGRLTGEDNLETAV